MAEGTCTDFSGCLWKPPSRVYETVCSGSCNTAVVSVLFRAVSGVCNWVPDRQSDSICRVAENPLPPPAVDQHQPRRGRFGPFFSNAFCSVGVPMRVSCRSGDSPFTAVARMDEVPGVWSRKLMPEGASNRVAAINQHSDLMDNARPLGVVVHLWRFAMKNQNRQTDAADKSEEMNPVEQQSSSTLFFIFVFLIPLLLIILARVIWG